MGMDFVGAGIKFPMEVDASGAVALVAREREIEEAIRLILGTSVGERPMRPEFGSRIAQYVFSPINDETAGRLAYEVRVSLELWEPRIVLEDVEISFGQAGSGVLYIDIRYQIRGSNDPRNLVFPFYVIPAHEALESGRGSEPVAISAGD